MKIITILFVIGIALYSCGLSINFKPFSVEFSEWRSFVAIILFALALSLIGIDRDKKSYKKGVNDGIDFVIKELKK